MLDYALRKAFSHSSGGRQRIWCVAVDRRGKILTEAGNSYVRSHPLQAKYASKIGNANKCSLHAECAVIARLYNMKKTCYALYVARARRDGKAGLAKPCEICALVIKQAGIEHVFYTI